MAVDLFAVGVLSVGGWSFLALVFAVLCGGRALNVRRSAAPKRSRRQRWTYGGLGALLIWGSISGWSGDGDASFEESAEANAPDFLGIGKAAAGLVALRLATTPEDAAAATTLVAKGMLDAGEKPERIKAALAKVVAERPQPWLADAVQRGLAAASATAALEAEGVEEVELARAWVTARDAGHAAEAARLRAALGPQVAAAQLARQKRRIEALENEQRMLAMALERRSEIGLRHTLQRMAEDLGLGVSWAAFYFTFLLTVWRGQTLGKRLLRIRVIRLDGHPLGWWGAFNRFGGYAASAFTGLLGFFEMLWDPNRQALHDRVVRTVVVDHNRGEISLTPPPGGAAH